jgi:hypothetical protein
MMRVGRPNVFHRRGAMSALNGQDGVAVINSLSSALPHLYHQSGQSILTILTSEKSFGTNRHMDISRIRGDMLDADKQSPSWPDTYFLLGLYEMTFPPPPLFKGRRRVVGEETKTNSPSRPRQRSVRSILICIPHLVFKSSFKSLLRRKSCTGNNHGDRQ